MRARAGCLILLTVLLAACSASPSSPPVNASKLSLGETSTFSVSGVSVPGTPTRYDRVMVRRFGSPNATNVLVLVPGTLAGAADFDIVGPYLAEHVPNLQVWAEMRREGALEDNSMLLNVLNGKATIQQAFNYYLGWITNSTITPHYQPLKASDFGFADQWGLAVAMGDLHNVVELARDGGKRTVILGGHSLGGAEASIYPVWDFDGRGGYQDIAGIVGIDGDAGLANGFGGMPTTSAAAANAALAKLQAGSPWLDLLGFGLPWITGPFAELGALAALKEPHARSINQEFQSPARRAQAFVPGHERGVARLRLRCLHLAGRLGPHSRALRAPGRRRLAPCVGGRRPHAGAGHRLRVLAGTARTRRLVLP